MGSIVHKCVSVCVVIAGIFNRILVLHLSILDLLDQGWLMLPVKQEPWLAAVRDQ